jgi:AraC family transcriptional activator of mtrCDE
VAEAVGYLSEAAFQRAFKSHMGITPAQWRKAAQTPATIDELELAKSAETASAGENA